MKMKKIMSWIMILTFILTLGTASIASNAEQPSSRKIIAFKANTKDAEKDNILNKLGIERIKDVKSINAVVANISSGNEKALKGLNNIAEIEDDITVEALGKTPTQPEQILSWGVGDIGADKVWTKTTADKIKVGIIDTGIDLSHPDLAGNIKGGINTINTVKSYADDNGHGTHVAGIIAAMNNKIGVVGVGPDIDLYSIKALNAAGSGYLSDIIEGLDWAITNKINVINMSLGTTTDSTLLHNEITKAYNAGIVLVAAAGNDSGGAVEYPGAYPEVIAVSAVDKNNNIASFSSIGPQVALAAPGVSVYSTYKGSTYVTMSGTSMATPHVAGAAAILLSVPAKCDLNGDGKCTPDEVKARLEATAVEAGTPGFDNFYGYGIVNVYNAITQ